MKSEERADPKKTQEERPDNICYIFFINTVHFSIFVNKFLFNVTNLFNLFFHLCVFLSQN